MVYLLVYVSPIVFNFAPSTLARKPELPVESDSSSGLVPVSTGLPILPAGSAAAHGAPAKGAPPGQPGRHLSPGAQATPSLQRGEASVAAAFSGLTAAELAASEQQRFSAARPRGLSLQHPCSSEGFAGGPGAPVCRLLLYLLACLNCTVTSRFITVVHSAQVLGVFKKAEQFSLFLLQVRRRRGLKKWPISQRALRFPVQATGTCVLTGRLRRRPGAPLRLSRLCFCND